MKIALTSFYLPPVDKIGVGYQAHYTAQGLVQRGHSVTMISPAPKVPDAEYEHRQIEVGNDSDCIGLHGPFDTWTSLNLTSCILTESATGYG